jgi:hypothetical protein
MSSSRTWSPLLDRERAQLLEDSVLEIAAALQAMNQPISHPGQDQDAWAFEGPHLGGGAPGIAAFFGYLAASELLPEARDLAFGQLDIAIDAASRVPMGPSLFTGFSGIGWALEHVSKMLGSPEDLNGEIDAAVEKYVSHSPWREDFDLISGLVGIGVYCLERSSASATRSLELIVDRLRELAEPFDAGVRWLTGPGLFL